MPKKNSSMALALPELPEEIQQRIVVSLPPKAFARSSVLSKSWLSFYNSTRCSFNFNFHYNPFKVHEELSQKIMNFDNSLSACLLHEKLTVEEFNINISHFSLSNNIPRFYNHELRDLVYKWLAALFTTNNIVKVLRIQILISSSIGKFCMPPEIFSNESLQVLDLQHNCILDQVHSINLGCLRVLSLEKIDGESTNRLLTACPILEQLSLSTDLGGYHIIIKGLHKLKDLHIENYGSGDVRIQEAPALEDVCLIVFDDQRTIINAQLCRTIKILSTHVNSKRTATHIQQIVSCLPALENLTLSMNCATDITISSGCLKNLELYFCVDDLTMVKINAPNLRCYQYESITAIVTRQFMMQTGMLEMVVINLMNVRIQPRYVLELRKALRMVEHLKLGVDTVMLDRAEHVCIKASRLDEKLNVSATRVIEMLDAGAMKFVDGKLCF